MKKRTLVLLFAFVGMLYTCSSDGDDNFNIPNTENSDTNTDEVANDEDQDNSEEDSEDENTDEMSINLLGVWDLTGIDLDDDTAGTQLTLLTLVLESLLEDSCEILTLTFNEDGTLLIGRGDFGDLSAAGLSIDCPESIIVDETTWSVLGNELTITFEDGTTTTVVIDIAGDTALLAGAFVNVLGDVVDEEELGETQVVFTRRS